VCSSDLSEELFVTVTTKVIFVFALAEAGVIVALPMTVAPKTDGVLTLVVDIIPVIGVSIKAAINNIALHFILSLLFYYG
jgi:hypothetical protein